MFGSHWLGFFSRMPSVSLTEVVADEGPRDFVSAFSFVAAALKEIVIL